MYDVIIIGGGPAGAAAAVYSARKRLKTLLITESFGGQSIVSDDIQNWIGETHISGFDLAQKLEAHVRAFSDPPAGRAGVIDIKIAERATEIKSIRCSSLDRICDFDVKTDQGTYEGKALILAMGARRRKMGVAGEEKFNGKGVAYCSTCDAPLFAGKKVAVVGGGNAGLEAVADLFPYASEIYLLHRGDALKGDPIEQAEIKNNPKLKKIVLNAEPTEIEGDKFVSGLKYKDIKTGKIESLPVEGVFVEIGSVPNTETVKELVELDNWGQVVINAKHASTSHPGVYAAGDITDDPYKQNNISAGDGVRAALAAYSYLQKREKLSPASE
ncbi:MAG: Alkyl hydroperoxide reductase, F subunit [Candidatus Giovannonibacteria bacterium GW2011_GWA2_44_13b]|uniref:Alkyl hydroperoxide reductase, F subunit n=1 Tax=Candidatus Giovannonibacteria bacterium GW2011_GWA2_44_13b TaxID=1618647 RepID=A0A0G1H002_9BACT|nr:MAG: Alkyl hydroperoxide reductase, F subunit [Candidatus Giovannonibacteria bacterium GW2011_GWA2_44_13b]